MNISSKGNVHKSSFGLCSRAPGPIKGSGAQKQRPQECLATLWFEKRVNLCSNPRFLKKKLKFQLTYGSSNWVSLIAIDFTQSTWFTTSKVNCKNISEFLSKKFPIDFQSPIDFSQLHMIRPLEWDIPNNFLQFTFKCYSDLKYMIHDPFHIVWLEKKYKSSYTSSIYGPFI